MVKDRSLESLGSLTAAHLYQCFLNIGLLADARESDVYTAAESEKLLDSVTRMLDSVDRRLGQLLSDGLKDEDKEAVENARQLGELLLAQRVNCGLTGKPATRNTPISSTRHGRSRGPASRRCWALTS